MSLASLALIGWKGIAIFAGLVRLSLLIILPLQKVY